MCEWVTNESVCLWSSHSTLTRKRHVQQSKEQKAGRKRQLSQEERDNFFRWNAMMIFRKHSLCVQPQREGGGGGGEGEEEKETDGETRGIDWTRVSDLLGPVDRMQSDPPRRVRWSACLWLRDSRCFGKRSCKQFFNEIFILDVSISIFLSGASFHDIFDLIII